MTLLDTHRSQTTGLPWLIATGLLVGLAMQRIGSDARASDLECSVDIDGTLQEVRLVEGAGDPADQSMWRIDAALEIYEDRSGKLLIYSDGEPLQGEFVLKLSKAVSP